MPNHNKIKALRVSLNLTQEQLADLAGISKETVSKIEQGRCKNVGVETIKRISVILGTSIEELLV